MSKPTTVVNKMSGDPYDVYIGRGSKWGNPFSHKEGTKAKYQVGSRSEAVDSYRRWIIDTQPDLMDSLHELKGKRLACYCKPARCHGDVLAELADNIRMQYREFQKDLFTVPKSFALVHCISADAEMGKGIAKLFRDKYPKMQAYIRSKSPKVGECIMYEDDDGQIIFNLITKKLYKGKPTTRTMEAAIASMGYQIEYEEIRRIAMPAIGCGLDKLEWSTVSKIVRQQFMFTDIKIAVCFN